MVDHPPATIAVRVQGSPRDSMVLSNENGKTLKKMPELAECLYLPFTGMRGK
jgi:hypothetical protein